MNPLTEITLPIFLELKDAVGADFIEELIESYCNDANQLMSELTLAKQTSDAVAFTRLAHSLKSTSLTFGATAFGNLAKELEMLGRDGRLGETADILAQLQVACIPLQERLKELCHA